jgi:DNA-binding phage protein
MPASTRVHRARRDADARIPRTLLSVLKTVGLRLSVVPAEPAPA